MTIERAAPRDDGQLVGKHAVLARAAKVMPTGGSAAGPELRDLIVRTQGAYLWNAEGTRYIDHVLAGGAIVIGHSDPRVNRAAAHAAATCDLNWMGPQVGEVELAEAICAVMPCADKVIFYPSGRDALLHFMELARAVTGRRCLLGFRGSHKNPFAHLVTAPRYTNDHASAPDSAAGSAAFDATRPLTEIVVEWNDIGQLRSVFADHGSEVAAVVCEPYVSALGSVAPAPGFLEELRALCSIRGSLLLFDEIKTGFRAHLGGYQAICGVTPDLAIFGNAIANGWTLGGLAGSSDIIDHLSEVSANGAGALGVQCAQPYAIASGLATFEILQDGGIDRLNELGHRMRAGITEVIRAAAVEACVTGIGSQWTLYFRSKPPTNYEEAAGNHNYEHARRFVNAMLDQGILEPPTTFGDRHLCLATSENDVDVTIEAVAHALQEQRR
jgi:glutamate-1-semialdehyde 2,1-aminomutase